MDCFVLSDAFPSGNGGRVTPVPIPNTVVKPSCADDTETSRESRALLGFMPPHTKVCGGFFYA